MFIDALHTGTNAAYDRLTVEFANGVPTPIEVTIRRGTSFTMSPSGIQTNLRGENGILIVIHGADLHTSYTGSTDLVTGYPTLAEVKRVEDFEGTVQLALGVNGAGCYRTSFLSNPNRFVIDVGAG